MNQLKSGFLLNSQGDSYSDYTYIQGFVPLQSCVVHRNIALLPRVSESE